MSPKTKAAPTRPHVYDQDPEQIARAARAARRAATAAADAAPPAPKAAPTPPAPKAAPTPPAPRTAGGAGGADGAADAAAPGATPPGTAPPAGGRRRAPAASSAAGRSPEQTEAERAKIRAEVIAEYAAKGIDLDKAVADQAERQRRVDEVNKARVDAAARSAARSEAATPGAPGTPDGRRSDGPASPRRRRGTPEFGEDEADGALGGRGEIESGDELAGAGAGLDGARTGARGAGAAPVGSATAASGVIDAILGMDEATRAQICDVLFPRGRSLTPEPVGSKRRAAPPPTPPTDAKRACLDTPHKRLTSFLDAAYHTPGPAIATPAPPVLQDDEPASDAIDLTDDAQRSRRRSRTPGLKFAAPSAKFSAEPRDKAKAEYVDFRDAALRWRARWPEVDDQMCGDHLMDSLGGYAATFVKMGFVEGEAFSYVKIMLRLDKSFRTWNLIKKGDARRDYRTHVRGENQSIEAFLTDHEAIRTQYIGMGFPVDEEAEGLDFLEAANLPERDHGRLLCDLADQYGVSAGTGDLMPKYDDVHIKLEALAAAKTIRAASKSKPRIALLAQGQQQSSNPPSPRSPRNGKRSRSPVALAGTKGGGKGDKGGGKGGQDAPRGICWYGDKCHRESCWFDHPKTTLTGDVAKSTTMPGGPKPVCSFCGKEGHEESRCWQKKGGKKGAKKGESKKGGKGKKGAGKGNKKPTSFQKATRKVLLAEIDRLGGTAKKQSPTSGGQGHRGLASEEEEEEFSDD